MALQPCGHRVLVKRKEVEKEVQEGALKGFEMVDPEDVNRVRENDAQIEGTITHIGPDAWKAFRMIDNDGVVRNGEPWASVGDTIYYAKFAGQSIVDPETEEKYYLLNDEDITVIVRRGDK
jgi:co-chaperonin GroES (HSP10)